jgi:hypothetical protein
MSWFTFDGIGRWQWPFPSPNQLGAVVAMGMAACVPLVAWLRPRWPIRALLLGAGAAWVAGCVALAMTYSRGAWAALIAALVAAMVMRVLTRRAGLLLAFSFLAIAAAVPSGAKRLGTIARFPDDMSITNRLLVWRGAAAMAADRPLIGVGIGRFGPIYEAWYQPLSQTTSYRSAINGPLTVAAEAGLPALWAYLVLLGLPLAAAGMAVRGRLLQPVAVAVAGALVGAQVAFLVAGVFTYLLDLPMIHALAVADWGLLIVVLGMSVGRNRQLWSRAALAVTTIATVFTLGVAGAGRCCGTACEARVAPQDSRWAAGSVIHPRSAAQIGRALFLGSREAQTATTARRFVRPLAAAGFAVEWLDTQGPLSTSIASARDHVPASGRVVLVGDAWGAQVAAVLAGDARIAPAVAGIVLLRPVMDAPTVSISSQLALVRCPVLIAGDDATGLAVEAVSAQAKRGLPAFTCPTPDMGQVCGFLTGCLAWGR